MNVEPVSICSTLDEKVSIAISSPSDIFGDPVGPAGFVNGNRWSLRASDFRNDSMRAKQAMEAFNIGIVITKPN